MPLSSIFIIFSRMEEKCFLSFSDRIGRKTKIDGMFQMEIK